MRVIACVLVLLVAVGVVGCENYTLTAEEQQRANQLGSDLALLQGKSEAIIAKIAEMKAAGKIDPLVVLDLATEAGDIAQKIAVVKGNLQVLIDTAKARGGGTWSIIWSILQQILIAGATYLGVRKGRIAITGGYKAPPAPPA